jgi:hypothetical protein
MSGQSIQCRGALEGASGLFQKSRVTIAREDVRLEDPAGHVTHAVGNLSLTPTSLVLLAALEAA